MSKFNPTDNDRDYAAEVDPMFWEAVQTSRPQIDPAFQRNLEEQLIVKHQRKVTEMHRGRVISQSLLHVGSRMYFKLMLGFASILVIAIGLFTVLPDSSEPYAQVMFQVTATPTLIAPAPTLSLFSEPVTTCRLSVQNGWRIYQVQEGDTLISVVTKYHINVDEAEQIIQANCLNDGRELQPDLLLYLPPPSNIFPVVVAIENIPRGTILDEDMLTMVELPREPFFPDGGVYGAVEQVVGKRLLVDIRANEVLFDYHVNNQELGGYELDPGKVAISFPLPSATIAYPFKPGDHVTITTLFKSIEVDGEFQTLDASECLEATPSENSECNPETLQQEIVYDAQVLQIGLSAETDERGIITLEVNPQDANILMWVVDSQFPYQINLIFQPQSH
ncbi:hypothetical protein HC928_03520 [bacterium]|nr:hypothetical protein [bacterium]